MTGCDRTGTVFRGSCHIFLEGIEERKELN